MIHVIGVTMDACCECSDTFAGRSTEDDGSPRRCASTIECGPGSTHSSGSVRVRTHFQNHLLREAVGEELLQCLLDHFELDRHDG